MTALDRVLARLRQVATSQRDLGDRFERLMRAYLRADPLFANRFAEVWQWQDWPGRDGKSDTGIDLVAAEHDGGVCAIQCKFYAPGHALQKADIDSFFTASGKHPFTSRLILSTTDAWSANAEAALDKQQIPVQRLRLADLADSPVDWEAVDPSNPATVRAGEFKTPRPHQLEAIERVMAGLEVADRGKLVMACGTGKTYTALQLAEWFAAEHEGPGPARVLFLVPSISLLSQSLREWTAQVRTPMRCFAVCSDTKVSKRSEDISAHDLAYPATTDPDRLVAQLTAADGDGGHRLSVVFSTYQSLATIHEAQQRGTPAFDLAICDEAHRTTGVTLAGDDESQFVRIHDADYIRARKRLYMTATPRLFDDGTKSKAAEAGAVLCSMDDESLFGAELHRLGFGEAVEKGLLTDYRVMVLAVDERYVAGTFQRQLADESHELTLEDAVKVVGCWNGLTRRGAADPASEAGDAPGMPPMRRAVAFCQSIKASKAVSGMFNELPPVLNEGLGLDGPLCEARHVDGTFNALRRNAELDWLKAELEPGDDRVRILSNARCLSEGVDVPALDAVLFLNPRNSMVDVVQSVGRVMRLAPDKDYGYIILPVGVPAGVPPDQALSDNKRYRVVWQVLQALRAHDDRFNATINKIELNAKRPGAISVIGVGGDDGEEDGGSGDGGADQMAFTFPDLDAWRDAIYGRIVKRCGDRLYWEDWAKDIAQIAERHGTRIRVALDDPGSPAAGAFAEFLEGLRADLNPAIGRDDAIEMLSQHLITKPVFDALFEHYDFAARNPVSRTMQRMLDALGPEALEKETETLQRFYDSVRMRAAGIDSDIGRQQVITQLYERFFKNAFPKMADRLGIVYTPIEIVDFIIESVQRVLVDEFGTDLGAPGVHVLDPFTGTGTFMVRLLQSRHIPDDALPHKFRNELHANELVLLAYYIAAINIEAAYHARVGGDYEPFPGVVLTDTFQLAEAGTEIDAQIAPPNHERVERQQAAEIRVILGNPPYSVGQASANDANANHRYSQLDRAIERTYVAASGAGLKRNLYDSYVRALRWASDRIGERGVIAFVTNGSFIDSASGDGLRRCLIREFDRVYCFNLRGDQRTSGERSRQEGGKVFGAASRTPVAITVLVRSGDGERGVLRYRDIGDYLSTREKLDLVHSAGSIGGVEWDSLTPDAAGDWINQRDEYFASLFPLAASPGEQASVFAGHSYGLVTNRDAWVYSFASDALMTHVSRIVSNFNTQLARLREQAEASGADPKSLNLDALLDHDPSRISWSRGLKQRVRALGKPLTVSAGKVRLSAYRPFQRQYLYADSALNETSYRQREFFPGDAVGNLAITVTGRGASRDFSALMVDRLPNLHFQDSSQCFPRWRYEPAPDAEAALFADDVVDGHRRIDNITPEALSAFRDHYGDPGITSEDVFFYVYGVLHHPTYRSRFAAELRKMLPRVPMAEGFHDFAAAGRGLSDLHVGYESVEPYPVREVDAPGADRLDPRERYRVTKMRHPRKDDLATVVYNAHLTTEGIPERAYEYVVNGKPAIEWIIDRYQVRTDKDSGIVNNPNAYSDNPRYIVDLLKRVVTVSLGTLDIVDALPPLDIPKGGSG
jgi:predicted helicase